MGSSLPFSLHNSSLVRGSSVSEELPCPSPSSPVAQDGGLPPAWPSPTPAISLPSARSPPASSYQEGVLVSQEEAMETHFLKKGDFQSVLIKKNPGSEI